MTLKRAVLPSFCKEKHRITQFGFQIRFGNAEALEERDHSFEDPWVFISSYLMKRIAHYPDYIIGNLWQFSVMWQFCNILPRRFTSAKIYTRAHFWYYISPSGKRLTCSWLAWLIGQALPAQPCQVAGFWDLADCSRCLRIQGSTASAGLYWAWLISTSPIQFPLREMASLIADTCLSRS